MYHLSVTVILGIQSKESPSISLEDIQNVFVRLCMCVCVHDHEKWGQVRKNAG